MSNSLFRLAVAKHPYLPMAPINFTLWNSNPYDQTGRITVVENMVLRVIEPTGAIEPTFHMQVDHAQQLMDELWLAGLRPTAGAGQAGAIDAVKFHLEDMRRLVFKGK